MVYCMSYLKSRKASKMSEVVKKDDLRLIKSQYSPDLNPLLDTDTINTKRRLVKSGLATKDLIDAGTGEMAAVSVIRSIEEKDDIEFVKVFAAGIAASYDLSKTGQRVFQTVLQEYESTPMAGGFADSVYLAWFGEGLFNRDIGMSERTFNRGLRELLDKKFLAPRSPSTYWVNPALFFKGDRVLFVREYKRKSKPKDVAYRDNLESKGQQRLID